MIFAFLSTVRCWEMLDMVDPNCCSISPTFFSPSMRKQSIFILIGWAIDFNNSEIISACWSLNFMGLPAIEILVFYYTLSWRFYVNLFFTWQGVNGVFMLTPVREHGMQVLADLLRCFLIKRCSYFRREVFYYVQHNENFFHRQWKEQHQSAAIFIYMVFGVN